MIELGALPGQPLRSLEQAQSAVETYRLVRLWLRRSGEKEQSLSCRAYLDLPSTHNDGCRPKIADMGPSSEGYLADVGIYLVSEITNPPATVLTASWSRLQS